MRIKLGLIFILCFFLSVQIVFSQEKAPKKETKVYDQAMKEIFKYYETKNFDKVRDRLESWMAKSPETFPSAGYLLLGNVYDHFKLFEGAIKLYDKGELIAENKFPFLVNKAQAYRHLKNHAKSVEILLNLKNYASFYPEIYLFLGMSFFELRDRAKTIENWENYLNYKPVGLKPDNVRKALAWLKRKDFKWPEELKQQADKEAEDLKKFLEELKDTVNKEKLKDLKQNPEVKEEKLEVKDKGKQEGERFDEVER